MSRFRKIATYITPYRWIIYAGFVCLLITNFSQVAIPMLLKDAVDRLRDPDAAHSVLRLTLIIISMALLQGFFRTLSRMFILNTARKIEFTLRSEIFEHLQKIPVSYFQKGNTGQIMALLTNDLFFVRMMYGVGTLHIVNTFISYTFTLSAIVMINARLAVMVTLLFPLVFICCRRLVQKIFVHSKTNQEIFGQMSNSLNESFVGVRTLKSYNAVAYREAAFATTSERYLQSNLKLTTTRLFLWEFMKAGIGIGMFFILAYGGALVATGDMTLGELVAFSAYLAILAWPAQLMGWVIPASQRGLTSFDRLQEIYAQPQEPGYAQESNVTVPTTGSIQLDKVSFGYETGATVLNELSLKIERGDKVLITGTIGSGKSTLLKLMSGLYLPQSGDLRLGDTKIDPVNQIALRSLSSYCPQEATIFSRSLRQNIMFSADAAMSFEEATRLARLEQDLPQFPQGWETLIGERGLTLSGGQRQRTAMARAFMKRAPILLLDDPIAQLDGKTARAVWNDLQKLNDTTVVLVSQRLIQPESFDAIYVLKDGRIAESGTHATLVKKAGLYRHLYDLQRLVDKEEA